MTDRLPSLRRNFSWTLLGNVVFAACLWGVLAVLTKLGSPDIVGRFALGSAIATPPLVFANLQLRAVLATDATHEHEFRDYFGVRLLMLPAALLVVLVVAVLGYNREQAVVIGLFGLVRCVESFSDIFYGFAQKQERLDLVARSLWIRGLSALALFGGAFWWTGSLALSLGAWVGAWVLSIVFFDWPCLRRLLMHADAGSLKPRWKRKTVKDIVWLTLPLGLVMLLINLRITIPRTFLESAFGEDQLGIFAALSYLVIAGSTVILALSQSSIARLAKYYAEGSRELFRTTILKIILVGVVVGIGGVLVAVVAGRPLLTLLYSPEYAEYNGLFVLIMVAGGVTFVGNLMGSPAMAMRLYRKILWVYLGNAIVLVLLAWILIPRHGMTGAAWAMLGGAIWVTIGNGMLIHRGISRMDRQEPIDRRVCP